MVDKYENIVFDSPSVIDIVISCIIQGETRKQRWMFVLKCFGNMQMIYIVGLECEKNSSKLNKPG